MMTDLLSLFIRAVFAAGSGKRHEGNSARELLQDADPFSLESVKAYLRLECPFLTEEKIGQMMSMYHDCWRKSPDGSADNSFFYTLAHFVEKKAVLHHGELQVKLDELLRWRQLAYWVGEDMLVCAWMAYRFRWTPQVSWNVSWNMTCGAYDADLQYLYRKGLADLHHHLKASTDVFSLSWICLMNHIAHRYKTFGKIKEAVPELYLSCCEAASIRKSLFAYMKGDVRNLRYVKPFDTDTLLPEHDIRQLQDELDLLRVESERKDISRLDYALSAGSLESVDVCNVFDGEHRLLCAILRDIYRGAAYKEELEQLLFRYLHTKYRLRMYLIQTNKNVGFANFSKYERRKDLFLEDYPEYEQLLSVLPVAEGKHFHHVRYLETRIAPKSDFRKMRRTVKSTLSEWKKKSLDTDTRLIVHFIKRNDMAVKPFWERHHSLRNDLRKQAVTLMRLRRRSTLFYSTLVGIDAANAELDCRPEVFAHAFRYVRSHEDDMDVLNPLTETPRQSLHYTYHAGEDFYDIIDGLRAIDEAVEFLELKSGDRLGHCLALGIDPMEYYREYDYKVVAKKQYLLDNVAWMLYKIKEASIAVPSGLMMWLGEKFSSLVFEIFQEDVSVEMYYASMQLRGDNPRYASSCRSIKSALLNDWESTAVRKSERLERLRLNEDVIRLFQAYHFNSHVRMVGDQMEAIGIGKDYVMCVRQLQDCMMEKLKMLGIIVECCPSSNLKIGLANRYDQQPIFRFSPVNDFHNPMAVTVNTDDLGIFQTSLDNEYSLLALSAMKAKDADDNLKYSKMEVVRWMERIRENGMKYAFGNKCVN